MISHLGRYEIIGELGQGAMGIVYKAKDPLIDRIVAIKTISLGLALDEKEDYEARFYQEAKAAGRLNHPNIVTVYDVGNSADTAFIAMEFLEGRELRDILDDGHRLPVGQVLDIAAQVAMGLAYAHEHGIVHRDVKPSNIMLVRDGHVKITDFGIARMQSSAVRTQIGMILGSPKYMSPEQVLGKLTDQRSDVFSLGVMLYEMLTGQPPFIGENVNAIMYQTLNLVPPPPSTLNPEVPASLDLICANALAKVLDERYQNAREFADDMRACRDTLPNPAARIDVLKPQYKQAAGAAARGLAEVNVEEFRPATGTGLPRSLDSSSTTIRLPAMTTANAGEVSRTLKMAQPSMDAVNQAAPAITKPKASAPAAAARTFPLKSSPTRKDESPPRSGNLLLIMIVLLVLTGLILAFVP
jgi:serine/threonine-protein kinase